MRLRILLERLDPVLISAARNLGAVWAGTWELRILGDGAESGQPDCVVRMGRASLVRSSIWVRWARPFEGAAAENATALALSPLAWEGHDGFEAWKHFARPVGAHLRLGVPDPKRDWVLAPRHLKRSAELEQHTSWMQLHFLGPARHWQTDGVSWWPSQRLAASLLGHSAGVFASPSPLAFDATRAALPLLEPITLRKVPPPKLDDRLAGLVSPSLARSSKLWRHVAAQTRLVAEGATPEPLFTPEWIAAGRSERPATVVPERIVRKARKLWREPKRFLADSQYRPLRAAATLVR